MYGTLLASKQEAIIGEAKDAGGSIIINCWLLGMGVDEAKWDLIIH
jgi:hypothetical protein